jgi:hypothetical protein
MEHYGTETETRNATNLKSPPPPPVITHHVTIFTYKILPFLELNLTRFDVLKHCLILHTHTINNINAYSVNYVSIYCI